MLLLVLKFVVCSLLQFLSLEEEASMPTCNLSETVHNKWLQASGNNMVDLYDATLDDYCRAALQSTQFHNFFKGHLGGSGPCRNVLKLRAATRNGNPVKVAQIVGQISVDAGLNSRVPHLEGESIFGSAKRKLDLPPGDDDDSHRHDRVNFSIPKLGKHSTLGATRCLKRSPKTTDVGSDTMPPVVAVVTRNNLPIRESPCTNPLEWRIERISPQCKDQCRGYNGDGKRCNARIAKYRRPTAAPTFTGIQRKFKSNDTEQKQFWFCPTNLEACVMGGRSKYIMHYADVPEVWPVMMGTNLSQIEIQGLESAGFKLDEGFVSHVKDTTGFKLEGHAPANRGGTPVDRFQWSDPIYSESDVNNVPRPPKSSGDYRPTMREGKKFKNVAEPSSEHIAKFNKSKTIECSLLKARKVPHPGYGYVFTIHTPGPIAKNQLYEVTIGDFPACTCLDFVTMKTSALAVARRNGSSASIFTSACRSSWIVRWRISSSIALLGRSMKSVC